MKKILSIILVCFFIPIGFIFVGCVPTVDEVAGTYKVAEIYSEGQTYKVGDDFNGEVLNEDSAILVLNKDETFSATYTDLDCGATINGIWDKIEKRVTFTSNGLQTIELNFDIRKNGDLLLLINNEAALLLSKEE